MIYEQIKMFIVNILIKPNRNLKTEQGPWTKQGVFKKLKAFHKVKPQVKRKRIQKWYETTDESYRDLQMNQ